MGRGKMIIKQVRSKNIEVFRCLLMFLICMYHAYDHGLWQSSCAWWSFVFALFTWHVDGFLAISGWFGIKFDWRKVARLYGVMCFYSFLSIGYGLLFRPNGYSINDIKISGGWFGNTYLFLMFLAPFLNGGIDSLAMRGRRALLWAWAGLAIVFTLQWTPIGIKIGVCHSGESVFSLFTFVFVYLTVRLMSILDLDYSWKRISLYGLGLYMVGFGIFVASSMKGIDLVSKMHNYRAPYVWFMACSMLLLFAKHIKLPNWLGNMCMVLGPSMFSVYLIHNTTSFGPFLYIIPERILHAQGFHPLFAITMSAVFCFISCVLIDSIRRSLLKVVSNLFFRGEW